MNKIVLFVNIYGTVEDWSPLPVKYFEEYRPIVERFIRLARTEHEAGIVVLIPDVTIQWYKANLSVGSTWW